MLKKTLIALCLMSVVQPAFAAGRGYLGVWFGMLPTTEKMVQAGVIVNKVFAGSAAEQAGLKPGEIVTQIDRVSVRDPKTAVALLAENTAGERISLTVIDRAGSGTRQFQVFATLAANPPSEFAAIMTAKRMPRLRHLPPASTAHHCVGSASMPDRPCGADVAAEHQAAPVRQ